MNSAARVIIRPATETTTRPEKRARITTMMTEAAIISIATQSGTFCIKSPMSILSSMVICTPIPG
jgi:hypothetical protein